MIGVALVSLFYVLGRDAYSMIGWQQSLANQSFVLLAETMAAHSDSEAARLAVAAVSCK